ncbi:MAG: FCD domain-containing protein [Nitriliruptorales bacterium]|nr:FCD domain-containing protein [Nitriliruptorales bacterium]
MFVPVAPGRISELIVDQIRQLIIDGRLARGERLPSERDLAERFRVSRVTVRDALRILEAHGLLEIRVGASGGAFVTVPSAAVVGEGITTMLLMSSIGPDEVAEARLLMELGIVALAVQRATAEDIGRLREVCARSEAALAAGEYDVALSAEFHALVAAAAHNGAVQMITESFRGPLSMHAARAREPAEQSHSHSVAEHLAIVDAIEARDLARARGVMTDHLLRDTTLDAAAFNTLYGVGND